MTELQVVFFDLDGTLADSLHALRTAYDSFLVGFGRAGSDAEFAALNGPSIAELPLLLSERHGFTGDAAELRRTYIEHVHCAYEAVVPTAGTAAMLDELASLGLRCLVVTANAPAIAEAWLTRNDLLRHFNGVIGARPGLRGKPAPDLYLEALRTSRCEAAAALAVEDSANGVLAARAAGLRVVRYAPEEPSVLLQADFSRIVSMSELLPLLRSS